MGMLVMYSIKLHKNTNNYQERPTIMKLSLRAIQRSGLPFYSPTPPKALHDLIKQISDDLGNGGKEEEPQGEREQEGNGAKGDRRHR